MSFTFLSFQVDAATVVLAACGSLTVSALGAMLPAARRRGDLVRFWWSGAFLLGVLGFATMLASPASGLAALRVASNLIFMLAYGFAHAGARGLGGRPVQPLAVVGGALCWVVVVSLQMSFGARVLIASLLIIAYAGFTGYELRRGALPEERARHWAARLCWAHGLYFVLRAMLGPTLGLSGEINENALTAWGAMLSFEAILFATGMAILIAAARRDVALIESERLAHRDHLTGTGNRRAFEAAFARLAGETGSRTRFVLMLLDLDGFKAVNDRHGHPVGDALLVHFVAAARTELPEPELLWRLGGDEFAAIVRQCDMEEVRDLARRLADRISGRPLSTGVDPVPLSVTIGMAEFVPGMSLDVLVGTADARLYEGKRRRTPAKEEPRPVAV